MAAIMNPDDEAPQHQAPQHQPEPFTASTEEMELSGDNVEESVPAGLVYWRADGSLNVAWTLALSTDFGRRVNLGDGDEDDEDYDDDDDDGGAGGNRIQYRFPFIYTAPTQAIRSHIFNSRPRHVDRLFRSDNDEPAREMYYLRVQRQCVCRDGRDRSRCSCCHELIQNVALLETCSPGSGDSASSTPQSTSRMPPDRVFRDILMSDIDTPLEPKVRDALMRAFNKVVVPTGPTSTGPRFLAFTRFPFEVRRMVWEMAIPTRVLLMEDLSMSPNDAHTPKIGLLRSRQRLRQMSYLFRRDGNYTQHMRPEYHTTHELWRSDLFYTCREARSVVEQYEKGSRTYGRTSDFKLLGSHDVLYRPWRGVSNAQPWTNTVKSLGLPLASVALDVGWLDKCHKDTLEWIADNMFLTRLYVVVADIFIPVRIPVAEDSPDADILRGKLVNRDFTVRASLYDDNRIEELLSLQGPYRSGVLNKSARHRCIACTRRAWEARDWASFGKNFGAKLQKICRPTIVFAVVVDPQVPGGEEVSKYPSELVFDGY